eukprot:6184400-Pleurochrysis_carterae.AAC.2
MWPLTETACTACGSSSKRIESSRRRRSRWGPDADGGGARDARDACGACGVSGGVGAGDMSGTELAAADLMAVEAKCGWRLRVSLQNGEALLASLIGDGRAPRLFAVTRAGRPGPAPTAPFVLEYHSASRRPSNTSPLLSMYTTQKPLEAAGTMQLGRPCAW